MPEGHSIHRYARDLGRRLEGRRPTITSPQGRFAEEAERLSGRKIRWIEPYGKHLFLHFSRGDIVHVHLGMYGAFRRRSSPPPEPRGAIRMRVVSPDDTIDLSGPTACELMDADGREAIIDRLGVDPLRDDCEPDRAKERILGSRGALGALLLNQACIAGVGNIFRIEAMFESRLHPERSGRSLDEADFDTLWSSLDRMMRLSLRYGRIIAATREEVGKSYAQMRRQERLRLYAREACPRCEGEVRRWEQGGRVAYACERCQPPA